MCAAFGEDVRVRDHIRAEFPPPVVSTASIAQQRRDWESAVASIPLPDAVRLSSVDAGVPAALLTPAGDTGGRLVVHVHGGGFTIGSSLTHRSFGAQLALAAKSEVLLVDYRLAPEHGFPAARDDVIAAYRWALKRTASESRIFISADSAGAHVALSAVLELRSEMLPSPAGLVLLSPWLDLAQRGETMRTRASLDPLVLQADLAASARAYLKSRSPLDVEVDLLARDLSSLPPLLVHVGDQEILLSDATRLVENARGKGVDAEIKVWPELWHVFHLWAPRLPDASEALGQIGVFIRDRSKTPR
jgi:acetyl esterase/lipase